jgi:uncharacterized SAM-binding protein YcdF (DUF218 family)
MFRKLGAALALAALLVWAAHRPLLRAAGEFLVEAHPPVPADMVLVLAGDGFGDRILKGAELVREGWAPKVLVSGPDGSYGLYECDLAIPFAVRAGYPEEYFLHFENTARSTREEAHMAARELRRRGVRRVLVVTSDYHTRRSARMYAQAAPDLEVTVVAAPSRDFTPDGWWRSRQGQKLFLYEWLKTIATWLNI